MGYRKEAAKGLGEGTIWIIIIGALGLVIAGFFFVTTVLLAPAKGAGEVVIKNNSATNRIEKQELFEDLNAKVIFNKELVAQHKATLETDPDNAQIKQILSGVKSACSASVERYNAEARKITSADWKAVDLPEAQSLVGCN